jgi:hypothetical protein
MNEHARVKITRGPRWYNYILPTLGLLIFYLLVLERLMDWSKVRDRIEGK